MAAAGATLTPHMEDTAGKAGTGAAEDVEEVEGSLAVHSVCRQWISKGAGSHIPTIFTLTTPTPSPPPSLPLALFYSFRSPIKNMQNILQ